MKDRRSFLSSLFFSSLAFSTISGASAGNSNIQERVINKPSYKISLAEWSVRELIRSGRLTHHNFPAFTKDRFGIGAVEYVSTFFDGKERDKNYMNELKKRSEDVNVRNVLIMVDMNGPGGELANPDKARRLKAAEDHFIWVEQAKHLGCHAIRVNARGYGNASYQEAIGYFLEGLDHLAQFGQQAGINVLVENHGGFSSNGRWLSEVMKQVDNPFCGTLPDFGNFKIDSEAGIFYDPLVGLSEIIPYAKGISAKTHNFSSKGQETTINYPAMMEIVKASGFSGYIGIEFGGAGYSKMEPEAAILATKKLLGSLIQESGN